ncbi:MAG: VOC family protein [Chloroflexi bacterium]|nr:VOC family protein [Chloroflexota bacterium]
MGARKWPAALVPHSSACSGGRKARPGAGGWARFQIVVDDIESEVSRLKQKGVQFKHDIIENGGRKQTLCLDPSGNMIELFQPASQALSLKRVRYRSKRKLISTVQFKWDDPDWDDPDKGPGS